MNQPNCTNLPLKHACHCHQLKSDESASVVVSQIQICFRKIRAKNKDAIIPNWFWFCSIHSRWVVNRISQFVHLNFIIIMTIIIIINVIVYALFIPCPFHYLAPSYVESVVDRLVGCSTQNRPFMISCCCHRRAPEEGPPLPEGGGDLPLEVSRGVPTKPKI